MKKKLCLYLKMIKEEPVITTFCFFLLIALVYVMNISLASYEWANYRYKMLSNEKGSITMMAYLYENNDIDLEKYEYYRKEEKAYYDKIFNKIQQDTNVKEVDMILRYYFHIKDTYSSIMAYQYNDNLFQNINMNLCKGRWFEKEDEIVLTNCAMGHFKLGDTIVLMDLDNEEKEFHIVGFLENDLVLDNGVCASKNDTTVGYEFEQLTVDERQRRGSDQFVGILSPQFQSKHWAYCSTAFLKYDQNLSVQEAITYLDETYGEYAEFYDFDVEYEKYKNQSLVYKNREEIYLLSCMVLLFCIGFCVNSILRIQKKKKEFAIYYIYGLTWGESIVLSYMKNLLIILIAIPLGSLGAYIRCLTDDHEGWIFHSKNAVLVFIILVVLYLIVSLPTYFHYKKQDPITLQRQGDV